MFEDHPAIDPQWRDDLFALIDRTPHLDWLLLTKRPENIQRLWPFGWYDDQFTWQNIWIGTTAENQETANERVKHLLKVPATVRFLSCEPLLGSLELSEEHQRAPGLTEGLNWLTGQNWSASEIFGGDDPGLDFGYQEPRIHWVIVGGESGPGCRQLNLDWVRDIQRQCEQAGVPFHFKQHGGITPEAGGCLLDGKEYKAFPKVKAA